MGCALSVPAVRSGRSIALVGDPGRARARAPLAGDVDCDVVVVGAGYTGLWTAYYLLRGGTRT